MDSVSKIQINKFEILLKLKEIKKNLITADRCSMEVLLADFYAFIHNKELLMDRYEFCAHKFFEISLKTGVQSFFALWDYVQILSEKYDVTSIFSYIDYQEIKAENDNVLFLQSIISFLSADRLKAYMEDFLFNQENIPFFDLGINYIYDAIILNCFKKNATKSEIGKLYNLVEEKNNIFQHYADYTVLATASTSSNYMYRNDLNTNFVRIAALCVANDLIDYILKIQTGQEIKKEIEKPHKSSKISYKLTYEKYPIESFYINKKRFKLTPLQTKLLRAIIEEENLYEFKSIKQRVHDINAKAAEIIKNDNIKLITKEDSYSDYRINRLIDSFDALQEDFD